MAIVVDDMGWGTSWIVHLGGSDEEINRRDQWMNSMIETNFFFKKSTRVKLILKKGFPPMISVKRLELDIQNIR